jgi:hypothetical protein
MTTGRINQVAPSHFKGHSGRSLTKSQPEHPSIQRDVEISCKTFIPCTSCIPRRKHTQHAQDMANKWVDLPSHNAPRPLRSLQPSLRLTRKRGITHPLPLEMNASKSLRDAQRGHLGVHPDSSNGGPRSHDRLRQPQCKGNGRKQNKTNRAHNLS